MVTTNATSRVAKIRQDGVGQRALCSPSTPLVSVLLAIAKKKWLLVAGSLPRNDAGGGQLPRHREPYCAFSTAWSKARTLEAVGGHHEAHALSAAHCWLLVASTGAAEDVGALRAAAEHFKAARRPREAAICSALAGDPRAALSHLGDVHGPRPTQLLLASALALAGQ